MMDGHRFRFQIVADRNWRKDRVRELGADEGGWEHIGCWGGR